MGPEERKRWHKESVDALEKTLQNITEDPKINIQKDLNYDDIDPSFHKDGQFDLVISNYETAIFYEVKTSSRSIGKAIHQMGKGKEFFNYMGMESIPRTIIFNNDFSEIQNVLDDFQGFFTNNELFSTIENQASNTKAKVGHLKKYNLIFRNQHLEDMRDWEDFTLDKTEMLPLIDYELMEQMDWIEKFEGEYVATDRFRKVSDIYDPNEIFHKTPRYDLFNSPYRESFETNLVEDMKKLSSR